LDARQILNQYKKAEARKSLWRDIYEECYEYALPQRNLYDGYYEGNVPGQRKMSKVFDSTAIHSTMRFANRIQSALFPPYKNWVKLNPGEEIPEDRQVDVQLALDRMNETMFSVLRQTNFDVAIGEFLLDLCVGTACMLILPGKSDEKPINFIPVPQYLISFDEGPDGEVENVYRKLRLKNSVITRQFEDATIPADLQQKIDRKPDDFTEFVEATMFDPETNKYNYCVVYKKTSDKIVERTYKTMPWVVSRYMKVAGEIYGRGPLLTAMPDIKTLNKTVELLLKNASINIAGVYTASDDGVLNPNTVRIAPGAIIPVARNAGPQGPSLTPLARSGDVNLSQLVINDLRLNVKKILLDESLPPENMSARSATEIVERMKELSQNLGSAFGRLISEAVLPIVTRTLSVMDDKGLIALPLKMNGLEVSVQPTSPLAVAASNEEVQTAMSFIQLAGQLGPSGQMAVNIDRAADYIADKLGVPTELRTTPQEREAMAAQMMQAQMMQAQAAQGQAQGPAPDTPPEEMMPNEQ
tara:strand:+ start:1991 stop:3571 length:1581 start_codon:yes stop_codon:yes gene_type:complete